MSEEKTSQFDFMLETDQIDARYFAKKGDVFLRATRWGKRKVKDSEGFAMYAELCVITVDTRKYTYIYYISEGGKVGSTYGGCLIKKVGRFKIDYDFDENFNLIKIKNDNKKED